MPHAASWFDRLRIESAVWRLDARLYELPRRVRIEKRREVRADLIEAAAHVGAGPAIRNLGGVPRLAGELVAAEYDDERARPLLISNMWAAAAVPLVLLVLVAWLEQAADGFAKGVGAANPTASGTFTWDGLPLVQTQVKYTFVNGVETHTGGALGPLVYVVLLAVVLWGTKPWRFLRTASRKRVVVA